MIGQKKYLEFFSDFWIFFFFYSEKSIKKLIFIILKNDIHQKMLRFKTHIILEKLRSSYFKSWRKWPLKDPAVDLPYPNFGIFEILREGVVRSGHTIACWKRLLSVIIILEKNWDRVNLWFYIKVLKKSRMLRFLQNNNLSEYNYHPIGP